MCQLLKIYRIQKENMNTLKINIKSGFVLILDYQIWISLKENKATSFLSQPANHFFDSDIIRTAENTTKKYCCTGILLKAPLAHLKKHFIINFPEKKVHKRYIWWLRSISFHEITLQKVNTDGSESPKCYNIIIYTDSRMKQKILR